MGIRRTFQYNTENVSMLNDGFQLSNYTDFHCRLTGANSGKKPYFYDVDNPNGLDLVTFGDRLNYKFNSQASLPVYIAGGLHLYDQILNVDHTLTVDNCILNFNTSGGDRTLNLPLTTTFNNTKIVYVNKLVRANKLIIKPAGAETISGYDGTEYFLTNPDYAIMLVSDRVNGVWRIFNSDSRFQVLSNEFGVNPTITLNSGTSQLMREYTNVSISSRDFLLTISGSGWYAAADTSRFRFFARIDGIAGTDTNLCTWGNQDNNKNIPFSGRAVMNTTAGLHSIQIRGVRETGLNTYTMDANNWFKCELQQ
jgi:hypothetical protein